MCVKLFLFQKFFYAITEQRQLSAEQKHKALEALSQGAKNKLVKNVLANNNEKFLLQRDVSNLKAKLRQKDDNELPKFVELLQKDYGKSTLLY